MDLHRAFLDDIVTRPDDDAPRLIYADWLDDQGDEDRAEFIRLQVARARKGGSPEIPEDSPEAELLAAHRTEWTQGLSGCVSRALFHRGFVEAVLVHPPLIDTFRDSLERLLRQFPLRRVRVEEAGYQVMDELINRIASGEFRALQLDLDLATDRRAVWFDRLLEMPQSAQLRSLLIEYESADGAWNERITRLDRPGPLNHLTELGIGFGTAGEPLEGGTTERIIRSPALPHLAKLHLPFARFGVEAMRVLADSELRRPLTDLDLGCCHIPLAGWDHFARSPHLTRLKWLGLIGANVQLEDGWDSLRDHQLGHLLVERLDDRADFVTSSTFPRMRGIGVE